MVLALPLHFLQGIGPKISTLGKLIEISFALVAVGKPDRFALEVSNGPLSFKNKKQNITWTQKVGSNKKKKSNCQDINL